MIDLEEIKSRINPACQNVKGTESHERKMLCDEIESLRQQLEAANAEIERLKTVPMKYRRMAFNAQLQDENRELRQQLADALAVRENCTLVPTHELKKMQTQLAASQAREQRLLEVLEELSLYVAYNGDDWVQKKALAALALPADTSALEAMIAKAGEVMRERAIEEAAYVFDNNIDRLAAIRALPGVTLGDVK